MRKTVIALALALLPSLAAAQVYLPPGVGLPPRSVIGNALPQSGDAVAVSFAQLGAGLNVPALKTCSSHTWFNSLTSGGVLGCTQPAVSDISGFGTNVATWLGTPSSANLFAALSDKTGTGLNVFQTGPTLINPALGTPSALILTNATGLPVSTGITGFGTGIATALGTNVGSGGSVVVNGGALGTPSSGVGTNLTALNATQLTSGTIPAARTNGHQNGTATNDAAAAGEVGEMLEATLTSGSATALVTNTPKDIITLSVTAGDWDVTCIVYFIPTATTSVSNWTASVSTTANTLDVTPGHYSQWAGAAQVDASAFHKTTIVPAHRVSLSATTTYRCVGQANFTASTLTAYGYIRVRRIR